MKALATKITLALSIGLVGSSMAMADTYSELKVETDKLMDMDNGASEFINIFRKAQLGDAENQVLTGVIYQSGKIVPKNYGKAKEWYQLAADQNSAKGQYMMGYVYDIGLGVKRDKDSAFSWFNKSAEQGDNWAMLTMSRAYYKGFGVPKDYKKSFDWAQSGANNNHPESQLLLALYYNDPKMNLNDTVKAKQWTKKSCDNGLSDACDYLSMLNKNMLQY